MQRGNLKQLTGVVLTILFASLGFGLNGAKAQVATNKLAIELNSVKAVNDDCRMTLIIRNNLSAKIDELTLNLVLFDSEGTVSQSLALSAGKLRKNKTRVHQFDLSGVSCSNISRVLINDISECNGKGLNTDLCLEHLETVSAIKISLIQ